MASDYFSKKSNNDEEGENESVAAMTRCCRSVFGRLTQTASWGLAALQSLTLGDAMDKLPAEDQKTLRNLPARVYYGVNSDEAIVLRLLGVPRTAAPALAKTLQVNASEALPVVRQKLRSATSETWRVAIGDRGDTYRRIWGILDGQI